MRQVMIDRLIASNASRSQEREKTRKIEFFYNNLGLQHERERKERVQKREFSNFLFSCVWKFLSLCTTKSTFVLRNWVTMILKLNGVLARE